MLSKCDENESSKMAANIPTTMNEWSQAQEDQIIDEKRLLMASSTRRVMEKPITLEQQQQQQQQQQQPQQPLKCPRCDSSNTKFCYYNNYSLSQPRHFCKACKRYWTRGGTLRNVPVGGGCRKNKRVKRPSSSSTAVTAATGAAATTAVEPPVSMASIDNSTTSSSNPHHVNPNPLFYDMNSIPYPRLNNSSIIDHLSNAPHFGSGLGLGFSSGSIMTTDHGGGGGGDNSRYIQDLVSSASFLPSNYSSDGIRCISTGLISPTILSSSTSTTTTAPMPSMASLLSSSIQQQKQLMNGDLLKDVRAMEEFKAFSPFQDPRGVIGSTEQGLGMKDVKLEGQNIPGGGWSFAFQNQMDHQVGLSSDLSSPHYWNISNVGGWHDPTNNGSSVPSMI